MAQVTSRTLSESNRQFGYFACCRSWESCLLGVLWNSQENAMRDSFGPVNAAQVQTELGLIYVLPVGTKGAQVHAPHLTVDGVPLQASASHD